jgi:hypothetical protein
VSAAAQPCRRFVARNAATACLTNSLVVMPRLLACSRRLRARLAGILSLSSTLSIRKVCVRSELSIGMLSLAPRRPWPGTIRRVNDSLDLAHVGGQGKADRLEYTADISGHRRAHNEVFAVLLHLNVLKPIEIHQ